MKLVVHEQMAVAPMRCKADEVWLLAQRITAEADAMRALCYSPPNWIELPQKGQHAPRMASTQCRRARRTGATKRYRLFKQRCR